MNQCDAIDGVADGILEDPSLCLYNPSNLLCDENTANGTSCLTQAQVETVRRVYSDLTDPDGSIVYPRMYVPCSFFYPRRI
jgi:feruloyl esterase